MMSRVTDQPLLIIADCYRDAQNYAREHGLGPERGAWRYVSHVHDVQGLRSGTYVTVSTGAVGGRDLQDRIEVGEYLRAHGFQHRPDITDRPA